MKVRSADVDRYAHYPSSLLIVLILQIAKIAKCINPVFIYNSVIGTHVQENCCCTDNKCKSFESKNTVVQVERRVRMATTMYMAMMDYCPPIFS